MAKKHSNLLKMKQELDLKSQILDLIADSIFISDIKGNLIYINQTACKMRGNSRDELMKMNFYDLDIQSEKVSLEFLLNDVKEDGYNVSGTSVPCKDGLRVSVQVNTRLIETEEKKFILHMAKEIPPCKEVIKQNLEVQKSLKQTIDAINTITETKDPYTAYHQRRVSNVAYAIAKELGFSPHQATGVAVAGVLHDIGKIYVPNEILTKPGKISDIEFSIIKTHSQIGYDILKKIDFPWPVATMVVQHHEKIDGTGYPSGISSEEILLESKILSVADVVEAISSHRPYRPALGIEKALEEISKYRGVHYDSDVVDACIRLFEVKDYQIDDTIPFSLTSGL